MQNAAGCHTEGPQQQKDDLPPRRDHGATSRTPTGGGRGRKDKEPAASRSRTHITIERDQDGRPKAVERRDDYVPPPPRRERRVSPPPVEHPTLGGRLGRREGVGENDARLRIDRLHRSLVLEEEDELGPPCFGPRIRDEPFPKGFTLPRDTPKYTGSVKTEDWLVDYATVVDIASDNKRVAVKYVPLMLQGTARTWLNSLKPRSITSWVDFTEAFVRIFMTTYKRPPKPRQLSLCVQGPDESTRDYLTRWAELRNSCEGVHEVQAIEYFTAGCREGTLLKHKLLCDEPETLDELLIIADKYATADSSMKAEIQVGTTGKVAPQAPRTPAGDAGRRQQQNDHKRKAPQPASNSWQVATVDEQQPEGQPPSKRQKGGKSNWLPAFSYEQTLDGPCKFHSGAKPSNHTARKCHWLTRLAKGDGLLPPPLAGQPPPPPPPKPAARPVGAVQDEYPEEHGAYVVFTSMADDRRSWRLQQQEVNAVASDAPEFMHWSEKPISWSRADHPEVMPTPGSYALVLDATFATDSRAARFSRVLIDGDSSINILYKDTVEKLGIKQRQLQNSRTVFHGIVPGLSCSPIGNILIDVLFGDKDHFRRESVWFEAVDLESPYHALLGRPALSKFMAVPHYAYLKMKMPSSKGILTVVGDYRKSSACAAESSRLAESLVIAAEKRLLDRVVAMAGKQPELSPNPKESEAGGSSKPAKETKKIPLDPEHPERYTVIGANLNSK